jgi:uncharacterized protein (DUF1697 family)
MICGVVYNLWSMPRYVVFLRGVTPMNVRMPELKRCFEAAGFQAVRTVLASGNVILTSRPQPLSEIERQAEAAMQPRLGRTFYCIARSVDFLQEMLEPDPFAPFNLPAGAKRVVTFLRTDRNPPRPLPIELDGARILATTGREAFTAYTPSPRGPVFMALIEKTFGTEVTTRTWDTVKKCIKA